MAVNDNLQDFVQAIVNAVGAQTGDTQISAQDLPNKISSLQAPIKSLRYNFRTNKFIINNNEIADLTPSDFAFDLIVTADKLTNPEPSTFTFESNSTDYKMSMIEINFNSDGKNCYAKFEIADVSLRGEYTFKETTARCSNLLIKNTYVSDTSHLTFDKKTDASDTLVYGYLTISFCVER